jgi:DUF1680 family protein
MKKALKSIPLSEVSLLPGILKQRTDLNRKYMMSLKSENLLQNHYMEAGLWNPPAKPEDCHWGWESPTSQVRGHFLGHWLSAAAMYYNATGDMEVKAKADHIVSELGRCQKENGGEWVGSIPEKYLHWIAKGRTVWAPMYIIQKTLMGLYDMYEFAGNEQALEILENCAKWFTRWTNQFTREQMDRILDFETGGMLELWSNLYGVTGKQEHLDHMEKFDRHFLFDRLIAGEDALTNMHANTTIPEILGAARAYEVTGDKRWKDAVEAYWNCAVTERGYFCTGGQTSGEVWTPPFEFLPRLGAMNQEHCTVYNMMRLAGWLLTETGDPKYADYIERNLYNGIFAQQNPATGMVAYMLPLEAGGVKVWGTPTENFWCCHGTLVQANAKHGAFLYYSDDEGIVVSQYFDSRLNHSINGIPVRITQTLDNEGGNCTHVMDFNPGKVRRPESLISNISVDCEGVQEFTLKLRLPWWISGKPVVTVNGEAVAASFEPSSYLTIKRVWSNDKVRVELPKSLTLEPLPDKPDMAAFMDGPVVLAGLTDKAMTLYGDINDPKTILRPYNERMWSMWSAEYFSWNQSQDIKFVPLHSITDQKYTVYFTIKPSK